MARALQKPDWWLAIGTVLILLPAGIGWRSRQQQMKAAIDRIYVFGGSVDFDRPRWFDRVSRDCPLPILDTNFRIDVRSTEASDADLEFLFDLCEKLGEVQQFHLGATDLSDVGMKQLARFPGLEVLVLDFTQITNVGLKELRNLPQLRALSLAYTNINDAGLPELASLRKLDVLDLSNTSITDTGLVHLQALPNLRRLRMEATRVTDDGVRIIRRLTTLESLKVSKSNISDEGVFRLKEALPNLAVSNN